MQAFAVRHVDQHPLDLGIATIEMAGDVTPFVDCVDAGLGPAGSAFHDAASTAAFVARANGFSSVLICGLRFTAQAKTRTCSPFSASASTISSSAGPTKIIPA